VTGTVTLFTWANPHCYITFDVKDEQGNIVKWAAEMNSPTVLRNAGWSRTTLKPGDQLTISMNPSKAGTTVGVVDRSKPVLVNGKPALAAGGNNID
jgi:hypothetical protein